jgi:AcrR family transcriptional regulator
MPKIVDHEQYRKQLLAGCFAAFARHGYAAVSMKQLAEAAGVTTGTLYHYFPDKRALFEALVAEMSRRDTQRDALAHEPAATPQARIAVALALLERERTYFLQLLLLLLEYRRSEGSENLRVLDEANAALRHMISTWFGVNDGRLITLLCAVVDGLLVEGYLGQPHASFGEHAALLGALLAAYHADNRA